MKRVAHIAIVAGLLGAGPLQAQTTQGNVPVTAPPSVTAAPISASAATAPEATPPCELHVFPSADLSYSGPNYSGIAAAVPGLGVLGAAVVGGLGAAVSGQYQGAGDAQMKSFLAPEVQVNLLKEMGLLKLLKLPADTEIIIEKSVPSRDDIKNNPDVGEYFKSYDQKLNHGRPITDSKAKCYREFIIISVSIWSHSIVNNFMYRKFDEQHWQNDAVSSDYLTSAPKHFPAKSADKMEEASSSLRASFVQNFTEWATKKVKS